MKDRSNRLDRHPRISVLKWVLGCVVVGLFFMPTAAQSASIYTLKVTHHHVHGSCSGELTFDNTGVRYRTNDAKDARQWTFDDVQQVQFLSDRRLNIVTYRNTRERFGGDRIFKFEILNGTVPPGLVQFVRAHFPKPVSDRIAPVSVEGLYEIPVKHLHRIGGDEGRLIIRASGVVYVSKEPGESRAWRYSDLQSVGSSDRFDLRLGTYEKGPMQYGDTKEFRFQLKEPLNPDAYRFLWDHIDQLPPWRPDVAGKTGM